MLDMEDKRRRLRESNRLRMMDENVLYLIHYVQQAKLGRQAHINLTISTNLYIIGDLEHKMPCLRLELDTIPNL